MNRKILMQSSSGITLITLAITIIILIILAGVSISMITGEEGILEQSQNANELNIIAEEKEALELAYLDCKKGEIEEVTSEKLKKSLNSLGYNVTVTETNEEEKFKVIFNETTHAYTIDEYGDIEEVDEIE